MLMLTQSVYHDRFKCIIIQFVTAHIFLQEIKQDALPRNCVPGENLLKFYLREGKQQGFDRSEVLQKLDVNTVMKETEALLNEQSIELLCDRDLEKRSTEEKESLSVAGTSRSLPTSSSLVASDLIRSPPTNRLAESRYRNVLRDTLNAVGVPLSGTERSGFTLSEMIQMKVKKSAWEMQHKDYEVVFLGTGASIPSKYRNVSSTLINMR